jgi:hypothetical protein
MSEMVKGGSKFTDEDRRRAVIEYCVTGSDQGAAKSTGICRQSINRWRLHSEWWDEVVGEVRHEIDERILSQNLQIATKAGECVLDSLENGDEKLVWDKEKGEHVIKHVKPSGKDASVIGGISQDKARIQLNLPTSIIAKTVDMQALAAQFAELSRAAIEKERGSIIGECEEVE